MAKKQQVTKPTQSIAEKKARTTRYNTEGRVTIYSNSVTLAASSYDLRLRFGRITDANDAELVIDDLVEVFMSPQHAKVFLELLATKMADYQKKIPGWASLPVPEDISQDPKES